MRREQGVDRENRLLAKYTENRIAGLATNLETKSFVSVPMANTSEAPKWIVLLRNVFAASLAGVLFGCLLFSWHSAFLQTTSDVKFSLIELKSFVYATLASPLLLIIGAPIWLPVLGIALTVSVIFQNSIEKHLDLWCLVSPLAVWLTIVAYFSQTPPNSYKAHFSKFERLFIELANPDYFLFFIAASFSSFVFYRMSRKGLTW